jgi:glucosyl-3-phosphoglycerate synthase
VTERRAAIPARAAFDEVVLARRKAELGLTTSVVIPARDEGPRVGAVVAAVRRAMEPVAAAGVALVDELVVVDGASRDDTAAAAERAGARVVRQTEIDGRSPGKGAALQLGVASTSGDLVAFVDADVLEPDPWLAVGTLAPLLTDERLRLVKSAAQRAWTADGTSAGLGGGRVTELTVRPLLALLWPDVAHIAQPLAGEYAADRALLEALPFERGYGVELGLLLDTLRECGVEAIGQVDLGVRGHEHQPLEALGRMAAELVLVVADRLAREGRGPDVADLTTLMLPRPERDADGTLRAHAVQVEREELAPLRAQLSGGRLPARRGPSRSS